MLFLFGLILYIVLSIEKEVFFYLLGKIVKYFFKCYYVFVVKVNFYIWNLN